MILLLMSNPNGQVRNTSELVSAQLLTIQDNVASYKVKYKEKIGKDKNSETKEYLIGFKYPVREKRRTNILFQDYLGFIIKNFSS